MVYSDTSIILRFIRDSNNSTLDDKVVIRRNNAEGGFEITYTDENDGKPIIHNATFLPHSRVVDYVGILVKNQYVDEEKFKSVQLDLPAMPRVIVSGDKFNEVYYRNHLRDAIDVGLYMLEATHVVKKTACSNETSCSKKTSCSKETSCSKTTSCSKKASCSKKTSCSKDSTENSQFYFSNTPRHIFFDDEDDEDDDEDYLY